MFYTISRAGLAIYFLNIIKWKSWVWIQGAVSQADTQVWNINHAQSTLQTAVITFHTLSGAKSPWAFPKNNVTSESHHLHLLHRVTIWSWQLSRYPINNIYINHGIFDTTSLDGICSRMGMYSGIREKVLMPFGMEL